VTLGELRLRRADVLAVARRHGASRLRVFGSVARQTPDNASDLDLLVDLEAGRTCWTSWPSSVTWPRS
jgi:uncharacterized protein